MPHFNIAHVAEGEVDAAYALVRMSAPDLAPERWQAFAEGLIRRSGGVLAAFAEDGRMHGLATYRPDESLRQGRTLKVDVFVTVELSRAAPARAALVEALELLAEGLGCGGVTVASQGRNVIEVSPGRLAGWLGLGYELDATIFAKPLAEADRKTERAKA